jgi:hypothetical protein
MLTSGVIGCAKKPCTSYLYFTLDIMNKLDQESNMGIENQENWIAEKGAIITLVPRNAQLHFQEAIDAPLTHSINMHLDLDRGEEVRLPDGRSLNELRWTMSLIEGSEYNDEATKQGAIGFVFHLDESVGVVDYYPESCHIGSALKPEKFATLLATIQNGCLPDQIHITVRGMSYGGAPDGSIKLWDIKNKPHVSLIEMQFNIPLIETSENPENFDDYPAKFNRLPATSSDIRAMERKFTEGLAELRRETQKRWMGLVCLLMIAIVIFYFRS